jgi:F0F1-type ATP synthase assembly protein I
MPEKKGKRRKDNGTNVRQLGILGTIPIILVVAPLVGFFIGRWLDDRLGTKPFLLIVFLIFGFVAAGKEIWRLIKRAEEEEKEDIENDR